MMKFEFGDLHRFLVSSGIVLISLSLIVPWLFLKEPSDVIFTEVEFSALEEKSQALVELRQSQIAWTTWLLPFFAGFFCISGAVLSVSGLLRWRQVQKIIDEKQLISLKVDQKTLENMSPSDIEEKQKREAFEDDQVVSNPHTKDDFLAPYLSTEADVSGLISRTLLNTHRISMEKKIGRTYIDIVAEPVDLSDTNSKIYAIEVKYRRHKPRYSEIKAAYLQSINAAQAYGKISPVSVKARLVDVYRTDVWNGDLFCKLRDRLFDEFPEHASEHRIFGTSVDQLQELTPEIFALQMEM